MKPQRQASAGEGDRRAPHILYVIDEMASLTAGGTERQLLQMIHLMAGAGNRVQLCLFRGTPWLSETDAGCKIHRCEFSSFLSRDGLRRLLAFYRFLKAERFDVVQSFFIDANIVAPVIAWLAGVPVILGSRRNLNYWMTPVTRWLQRITNLFVTRLVANCEAVKQVVVESEGIAPQRVDVIYNGLDLERFQADAQMRRQKRGEVGFTDSHFVIGNVSVLRPIKGCETFIETANRVSQVHPHARFVLVGEGPLRVELENQVARLGLQEVFTFTGSQEDVRPFLNAFDAAVLCSESEGFSNSILEYLAMGLPTIATDVGGNAEAVGDAGRTAPVNDTAALALELGRLIQHPEEAKLLSNKALDRAKTFGFPATQARLDGYYRNLLNL